MNNFYKKMIASVATIGLAATMFTTTSFANETGATIEGSNASITTTPIFSDFEAVTLNGAVQTSAATLGAFQVKDASGSGNGWRVEISATQFTNADGTRTLPLESAVISAPTVTALEGASEASTVTPKGGAIDLATGSSLKLLSAAVGGGMGTFDISGSDLTLNLQPKNVYAGAYTSTATVSLVTGP